MSDPGTHSTMLRLHPNEIAVLLAAGAVVGAALVLLDAPVWLVYAAAAVCAVVYGVLAFGRSRGDRARRRGDSSHADRAAALN